jgi:hypothetical protein
MKMQIIDTDSDGMIVILFDSRWKNPETLGYKPSDPQYKCLRELWLKITNSDEESDMEEHENVTKIGR